MVQTLVRGINPGQVRYELGGFGCGLGMQGASVVPRVPRSAPACLTYLPGFHLGWARGWVVALTLLVRKPSGDV